MASYDIGGALQGGLLGGFGGKEESMKKFDTMSPEQKGLLNQLLQMLGGGGELGQGFGEGLAGLREMLDPSSASYQRFEQPYLDQFNQQTIPGIGERFAGAGAQGGALSSSGFGQALSSAGGQLQNQLAGMKSSLQQNAIRDILAQYQGMLGQGLGAQSFGYQQRPGRESFGQTFGNIAGPMAGKALGMGF